MVASAHRKWRLMTVATAAKKGSIRAAWGLSVEAFGGKRERWTRSLSRKKRSLIWWTKSPAINSKRKRQPGAIPVHDSRQELEDDDVTDDVITFSFSFSIFLF